MLDAPGLGHPAHMQMHMTTAAQQAGRRLATVG